MAVKHCRQYDFALKTALKIKNEQCEILVQIVLKEIRKMYILVL